MKNQSLSALYPKSYGVPILVGASVVCLTLGLILPVLTFKEMFFWKHTYSVFTGIQALYQEKYYGLALIIFVFSIIFPFAKLGTILALWFWPISESRRQKVISWIAQMGRWSMLDVFVLAITIVITRLSKTLSAAPRVGIYVFALSVLLAMIVTWRVERLANVTGRRSNGRG